MPTVDVCTELAKFEQHGFVLVLNVFSAIEAQSLASEIESALAKAPESARSSRGAVYAARNVLEFYPQGKTVWRREPLTSLLRAILGEQFGLVRALYFDKPPDRTWSLPWHQDLTVAVKEHDLSPGFAKPTTKQGVPHFEAPQSLLEQMATVRIHLDEVTEDNGPLDVIAASHRIGKEINIAAGPTVSVLANAGDCLFMRPLLVHGSGSSKPDTTRHRRILHLEFAGSPRPAENLEWWSFEPFLER